MEMKKTNSSGHCGWQNLNRCRMCYPRKQLYVTSCSI